jgi:hypothetical protein
MGFESVTIGEIDQRELKWRRKEKEMEFYWRSVHSDEVNITNKGILTHLLDSDIPCNLDNPEKPFTLKKEADWYFMTKLSKINEDHQSVLDCLHSYAQGYKSRHVMLRVGAAERSFMYAETHFNFLERVMSILDGKKAKGATIRFKYSNFDTYFKEAKKT